MELFRSSVQRAFDQYRRVITMAQASDKELKRLEDAYINRTLSPQQFEMRMRIIQDHALALGKYLNQFSKMNPGTDVEIRPGEPSPAYLEFMRKYPLPEPRVTIDVGGKTPGMIRVFKPVKQADGTTKWLDGDIPEEDWPEAQKEGYRRGN